MWNAQRRFQGQTDVPLSAEGREQARELAEVLAGESFGRIVSSDLARAFETASIIAGSKTVEPDARWREFAFGEWEGKRVDEIDPGVNARQYAPPGGETFAVVRERVKDALDDLRASGQRSLVVTHAGPLHAMLDVLFPDARVVFTPASITQVRIGVSGTELLSLGISVRQYAQRTRGHTPDQS